MKQLINYCPVHGYEQEVNAYADGMLGFNFFYNGIGKNRIIP